MLLPLAMVLVAATKKPARLAWVLVTLGIAAGVGIRSVRWSEPSRWSYAIYTGSGDDPRAPRSRRKASLSWAAVLTIAATSVLVGWSLFRLVESPFLRLRDRLWPTNFSARASGPEKKGAKRTVRSAPENRNER